MKKLVMIIVAMVGIIFGSSKIVLAENNGSKFSIESATKDSLSSGYIHYRVEAGQQKDFQISVINLADNDQKFRVEVVNAGVTSDASLSYRPDVRVVNTFQAKLPDMVTPKKQVITVPAKKSQVLTFHVKVPKAGFSGDVLGGIYVYRVDDTSKESEQKMGVRNAFSMSLPVHLVSGDETKLTPVLTQSNSKLKTASKEATVQTRLTNKTARVFGGVAMTTTVHNEDDKQLGKIELKDGSMAPAGLMEYSVPLEVSSLSPGVYTVKTKLTSGKRTYNLKDTFTIKKAALEKVAKDTDLTVVDNTMWYWIVGILIALVVALIVILIVISRRRRSGGGADDA
ncbi:WxL protein host-binding domain-containing protein [Lacticaseibacillus sp. N501-2]|uniref:WxL protein host-binding domain-containing protein n=1 Tax=Lacticaseibacillus salsurae TaxID=3367729 RepID=UPI0038B3C51A